MSTYLCDRCGACCRTFPVLVSEADASREPAVVEEGLELKPWLKSAGRSYQLHPLPFQRGCCFLGEDNLCRVYERRPGICREFEPGSQMCSEARARVGLEPLGQVAE